MKDISGQYSMASKLSSLPMWYQHCLTTTSQNKTLSGDTDAILAMQGIDWIKRKTLSMVSLNLSIKQSVADGATHIHIAQTAGSFKGEDDNRVLDWVERERSDDLFGNVVVRSRWISAAEIDNAFLKEGWLHGSDEHDRPDGEALVHTVIKGTGWVANEILGFAVVGGVRRLTKRVTVEKQTIVKNVIITYDLYA